MINFMRYKLIYFLISALVLIPGIYSLVRFGLKPSIDFTGGTLYEIKFSEEAKIPLDTITKALSTLPAGRQAPEVDIGAVQATRGGSIIFRLGNISEEKKLEIGNKLRDQYGEFEEIRFETVGPSLGRELLNKTLIAVLLAAIIIVIYVSIRFKDKMFGVSAVIAMFHDSLILLGVFSLLGHFYGIEVDTLFVTAVLTILSFSVHDTIVVYDRIRETFARKRDKNFEEIINRAVNETLVRSLNNSLTIIFMLTALVLLGGETIKMFVLALLIGTIAGTYSSTFTAAPLLVVWNNISELRKRYKSRS